MNEKSIQWKTQAHEYCQPQDHKRTRVGLDRKNDREGPNQILEEKNVDPARFLHYIFLKVSWPKCCLLSKMLIQLKKLPKVCGKNIYNIPQENEWITKLSPNNRNGQIPKINTYLQQIIFFSYLQVQKLCIAYSIFVFG